VLLAAYAVALARRTGRSPSVAQLVVSNRLRPGCADSVSQLAQLGICVIDVADTTFDEVVSRAWKAATNAYLHGYLDTVALKDMLARVGRERAGSGWTSAGSVLASRSTIASSTGRHTVTARGEVSPPAPGNQPNTRAVAR
jgi:hypothetical protein